MCYFVVYYYITYLYDLYNLNADVPLKTPSHTNKVTRAPLRFGTLWGLLNYIIIVKLRSSSAVHNIQNELIVDLRDE